MIQPQEIFEHRDIIIPVIGDNCFVCNQGADEKTLQEFVVDTLTNGLDVDPDLLTQMKTRGYYGLTLLKKLLKRLVFEGSDKKKNGKFKSTYRSVIENNKEHIHLNTTIKRFLQTYQFKVIVTTSCFRLIESELPNYKTSSFPHVEGNQEKFDGMGNTVYHIFGLGVNGVNWVTGEDELLRFVHELHGDGASELKDYILSPNKKKALFVIGSNLPDWLFRFFLYPMTDIGSNEEGYFLSSTDNLEDSFMNFLDDISYDYDVNANLENVLLRAIELYPSSEKDKAGNNRVPHGKQYDIFISYASENRNLACSIKDTLEKNYDLHVWLDQKQIVDGNYEQRILQGIDNSAYFMPIVTKEYIMKHRPVFSPYNTVEQIVGDSKLEFVQMETLVADIYRKSQQRITYSLPIVVPAPIGENGMLDFGMIENNYAMGGTLPENLFRRQQMCYETKMFNGERDWSQYKTVEI